MSKLTRLLSTAGAVALLAPAAASADAPWSAPVAIPGTASGPGAVTPAGRAVALDPSSSVQAPGTPSELVRLDPGTGAALSATGVGLAAAFVTDYAQDAVAVAGTSLGPSGTIDEQSRVRAGTTSAAAGTPTLRTLSGTQNQNVSALDGNARGDVAFVTRGGSSRMVFLRRHGATTFSRILTIGVTSQARDITVAVGPDGDLLVAWEDRHEVMARHRGVHGTWGAAHRLGPGVQSHLQAAVDPTGRLLVAWASQRVGEGDAATSPDVRFVTAAPGHGFGGLRTPESARSGSGSNVAVAAPAVRLVVTARSRALLAWTSFDGTRFSVRVSALSAGHIGAAQVLSPAGQDAVLGDVATTPGTGSSDGPTVVLWRSGPHGSDVPAGTTSRVFASARAAGTASFGAPEAVSEAGSDVPFAPTALVVPGTARPLALLSHLQASGPGISESSVRAPITP
ncbi:MAG TPA: hypothetical protein VK501_24860 [Baekduia sp.]|uniref:hypothetical protein n=1 Tax=Baekduia sp. TaxID=2600305 RepID=UPI002CC6F03D|nr:hypothetical protein [Baekduia sp.]HMJ37158.1 hypothetical protein [Baekduia sp.]